MTNGYYIGTKEEAENYDNIVTQGEGYNGTTTTVSYTHLTLPTKRIV